MSDQEGIRFWIRGSFILSTPPPKNDKHLCNMITNHCQTQDTLYKYLYLFSLFGLYQLMCSAHMIILLATAPSTGFRWADNNFKPRCLQPAKGLQQTKTTLKTRIKKISKTDYFNYFNHNESKKESLLCLLEFSFLRCFPRVPFPISVHSSFNSNIEFHIG